MKLKELSNRAIWKNRKLQALFLLIIFALLFKPPINEAIGRLLGSSFHDLTDFKSFDMNLTTPHIGEHMLPSSVQEMLALLRSHQVDSYQISGKIMKNTLLHQRIVESAWPRKMSAKSNYKIIFISEFDNSSGCREIDRKKEVALVFCY
jgi:hypothetical protein